MHELAHWRLAHNGLAAGIDRKDTSTWEADADALALDWFRSGFPEAVGPKGRPVTPTGYLAAGQWIFVHGYVCGPFRLKAEAARNPEDIYHLDRESVSDDIGCSPEDALRYGDAETFEELGALLHFYEIASDREAARFAMTRLRLAQKAVAGEKDPVRIKGLCAVLERWAMRAAGKCRPKDRAGIVSSSSGVTR
ncbi:MAG: hypothetical protein IT186_15910 [Acidobacteria bacterium]|nr:hypothetical protein [Acidobacteriota bacterium]